MDVSNPYPMMLRHLSQEKNLQLHSQVYINNERSFTWACGSESGSLGRKGGNMIVTISLVQDSLDCWVVATLAMLVLWIWQRHIRKEGPSVLSIEPDEVQLKKQKAFIQKTERLQRYTLCFVTASVVFGIGTIVAWLYQNVR
jgi:hypothetical protein